MVTYDTPGRQTVEESPALGPVPPRNKVGWFMEFSKVLFDLSLTLNRTFIIISVIALGAIAVAYWGAYTEHHRIAGGAMAVVGLTMLAYTAATAYMLWAVITGVIKWRASRRSNAAINATGSEIE